MQHFQREPVTDREKLEFQKNRVRTLVESFQAEFSEFCGSSNLDGRDVIAIVNARMVFADGADRRRLESYETDISQCLRLINSFSEAEDHSFLDQCLERDGDLKRALGVLSDDSHIHFVVGITLGGGTAGITRLLIDEIKNLRPDQRITVTFIGSNPVLEQFHMLRESFSDIEFKVAKPKEPILTDKDSLVVGIQLNEVCYVIGEVDISFRILPNEQSTFLDTDNLLGVTQNLLHPYGALPLDSTLFKRHQERNCREPDLFHTKRLDWMTRNVPEEFWDTLKDHSTNRGFDELRCAWSLAYFQDAEIMLHEFGSVCGYLRSKPKELLEQIGGRVLYFMVPGSHLYASFSVDDLVERGVSVITPSKIVEPQKGARSPVTVLLLDNLSREALLELNTDIAGTMTKVDGAYLEWPRIVTGNASWLECVSAGVPFVHDGYDGDLGGAGISLDLIVDRFNVLQESNLSSSRFYAGKNNPLEVYGDPRYTTRLAEEFYVAAQKANLAHDILRALAFKST